MNNHNYFLYSRISEKYQGIEDPDGNDLLHPSEMKFHSSWDWLMPVVEKIDNIRLQDKKGYAQSVDFSIFSNICTIETGGYTSFTICTIIKDTKIEAVWTACVEFIQWYNKQ